MTRTASAWRALVAALAVTAALPSSASAQEGVPLPKFNPAPAGDRFFGVPSPYAAGDPVAPHVMLLGDYAHNPLVVGRRNADGSTETLTSVVEHQLILHLNGGVALFNRLNINLDLPLFLLQDGRSSPEAGLAASNAFALGDLRLGLRARLFGEYYDGFQLGIGGYVWFPTSGATKDAAFYASDQNVRGLPQVYLGGIVDRFVWSTALGVEVRADQQFPPATPGVQQTSQSSRFDGGIGLGVRLGDERQFQIGPEATVGFDLINPNGKNVNFEALLGAKWRFIKDMEAGIAAGPGMTRGIGTPDVRVVASIAYTPYVKPKDVDRDKDGIVDEQDACPDVPGVRSEDPKKNGCPPPSDRDKDGIIDTDDACPDVPGVKSDDPKKNGCPPPPPDRDKDGIVDDQDACPDLAGVPNEDPKKHGCPPDKDGDGVYDADDACVDVPGIKTADKATNGCPPDTDGDGFRDDKDACPREKGVDDPDPTKRGCPKAVRVSETEIIILQQVQFDTAKAVIKKESDALLDEVAGVLKEHPELDLLEVQGHTDSRAARAYNLKLSEDRAKAVVKALEKRGIEGKRLTAKGYGPDRPIAGNDTEEGRQKNRRVQFIVLSRNGKPVAQKDQPQGAAGQPEPPKKPVTGVAPPKAPPKAPPPKAPPPKAPPKKK